jgi:hypothetical protein
MNTEISRDLSSTVAGDNQWLKEVSTVVVTRNHLRHPMSIFIDAGSLIEIYLVREFPSPD